MHQIYEEHFEQIGEQRADRVREQLQRRSNTDIDSFRERFADADFSRSCVALAGRELLSSIRSDLIRVALHVRYGIEDLGFGARTSRTRRRISGACGTL